MKKKEALAIIADTVSNCTLCKELSEYRQENNYHTVPGEGSSNARVMIIGEAPGKDEAEQGRPFVGRAGKLLTNIIETAGWKREEVFIANTLKCRPPNNRDPEDDEAKNCRKFLDLQIDTVDPEWIVCVGKIASRFLLGYSSEITMGALRGTHKYKDRNVLCTYHPSYLLRQPSAKKEVWDDLQIVISCLSKPKETVE